MRPCLRKGKRKKKNWKRKSLQIKKKNSLSILKGNTLLAKDFLIKINKALIIKKMDLSCVVKKPMFSKLFKYTKYTT